MTPLMTTSAQLARILKVLAVDTRVELLRLLKGRVLCVNALASRLNVTQGAVSQHLRIMRDAGLVLDEKRGYFVHYRLNEITLAAWREKIGKLLDPAIGDDSVMKEVPKCAAAQIKGAAAKSRKA